MKKTYEQPQIFLETVESNFLLGSPEGQGSGSQFPGDSPFGK